MDVFPSEIAKKSHLSFESRDVDYVFRYSKMTRNVLLQWYLKDATYYDLIDEDEHRYKEMIAFKDKSVPIFDIMAIVLMLRPELFGVEPSPVKVDTTDLEAFKFTRTESSFFLMPWVEDGMKQPELLRNRLEIYSNLKFLFEYSLRKPVRTSSFR